MDKKKLLEWIEMRISEHKQSIEDIHEREFAKYDDTKTYHYHIGARAELAFLRRCVDELKAFDVIGNDATE